MAHGQVPNVPIDTYFPNRRALYTAGIHRDIRRGICGSAIAGRGAESVVLSGSYEDDLDLGSVIYYTGQGGRDRNGNQVSNQVMNGLNASLARNVDTGDPVRVVRRQETGGFRYDGLFSVEDAWMSPGKSGFLVCRFRLIGQMSSEEATSGVGREGTDVVSKGRLGAVERQLSTHYRLRRDTLVGAHIKQIYSCVCQVCGVRLDTVAGPYAEAAHLFPLHAGGDDHTSNVLCLCPNHHVLLDHGAIALTDELQVISRSSDRLGELHIVPGHDLKVRNARLHRELMGFE